MATKNKKIETNAFTIGKVCTVHNTSGTHSFGMMYAVMKMDDNNVASSLEFLISSYPIEIFALGRGVTIVDAIDDFLKYCMTADCVGFISPEIYNAHIKVTNESYDSVWGGDIFQPLMKTDSSIDLSGLPYPFRHPGIQQY